MTLGERIYKLRDSLQLSQKEFAEKIGVSQSSIFYWESGKKEPKLSQLEKIADALEIPVTDLLFEKGTSIAKISDGNSSVYINMENIRKGAKEFFDSNPHMEKMTPQQIEDVLSFYDEIIDQIPQQPEPEIMKQYNKLNDAGKKKAVEYTTDLAQMPKYQRDPGTKE